MARFVVVLTCAAMVMSCSLARKDEATPCQVDSECSTAFGDGSRCGTEGFCIGGGSNPCSTDDECRASLGEGFVCSASDVCEPETNISCTSNADCRNDAAAGLGFACTASQFCATVPRPARCEHVFPLDLLTNPSAYQGAAILGAIYFGDSTTRPIRAKSIELAVRAARDASGIGGMGLPMDTELGFVACTSQDDSDGDEGLDGLSSADAALEMSRYLTDVLGAAAIVGPQTSGNTEAVFQDLDQGETVLISPSATSTALEAIDNESPTDTSPGFLWRTPVTDDIQAPRVAEIVAACSFTNPGIVFEQGPYGGGLADLIEADQMLMGATFDRFPYTGDQIQSQTINLAGVAAVDVGILIDSDAADVASGVFGLSGSMLWNNRPLLLTDGAAAQDFVDDIVEAATDAAAAEAIFGRLRGTRPTVNTVGVVFDQFATVFRSEFAGLGEVTDASFSAEAFDAAWMALYGMGWSILQEGGTVTPLGVARGLRKLSQTDQAALNIVTSSTTWGQILLAFQAGLPVNIEGASGELDYDLNTETLTFPEGAEPVEVWQVVNDGSDNFSIAVETNPGCPFQ